MAAIKRRVGETLEIVTSIVFAGDPFDLTDWGVECQIRDKATGTLLHEMADDRTNAATGVVVFEAPPSVTGYWMPGNYEVNTALISPTGQRRTTEIKELMIVREVTRHVG